jgi:hypothetical protein
VGIVCDCARSNQQARTSASLQTGQYMTAPLDMMLQVSLSLSKASDSELQRGRPLRLGSRWQPAPGCCLVNSFIRSMHRQKTVSELRLQMVDFISYERDVMQRLSALNVHSNFILREQEHHKFHHPAWLGIDLLNSFSWSDGRQVLSIADQIFRCNDYYSMGSQGR